MSQYLVTGAAGFIGSWIARSLIQKKHEVWTIDNLSTGYKENLPKGIQFIEGDCQDPESIKRLKGTKFDAVLHFAGQSSGEISFDNPVYDLRSNTESTLRLIDYALKHDCQRFIYASSMSVYGTVEDKPISEKHTPTPLSFYGVGKLASEHYLRMYIDKGLQPTSLRLFNIYGPNQNMKNLRQGMVSIFLSQMISSDRVVVKGALDRFRDFVYIDDVVKITCSLIEDERSYGEIINIGTGQKTTVAELLKMLHEKTGSKAKIQLEGPTPGDQRGVYADTTLCQKLTGFTPRWSLDKGLESMVEWAKQL